jgi:hypothetical protein
MVYPTISTSLLTILNVMCEMDPSKVNSINTVLSNYNPVEISCDHDRCILFGGCN